MPSYFSLTASLHPLMSGKSEWMCRVARVITDCPCEEYHNPILCKYHYKFAIMNPPAERHKMAFHWRADDGRTLNAGSVDL